MTYKILKGEELGFEYLQKIMDIDREVYSDLGMEGALEQMEKRYQANKETFVALENAESDVTRQSAFVMESFSMSRGTRFFLPCFSLARKSFSLYN